MEYTEKARLINAGKLVGLGPIHVDTFMQDILLARARERGEFKPVPVLTNNRYQARLPTSLVDVCKQKSLCMKYQKGTCSEQQLHTITLKSGDSIKAKHICAKCEAPDHGANACRKQ